MPSKSKAQARLPQGKLTPDGAFVLQLMGLIARHVHKKPAEQRDEYAVYVLSTLVGTLDKAISDRVMERLREPRDRLIGGMVKPL